MERVECDICPNRCLLTIDDRGICGDRVNYLGKFSAGNIDPIEKKPLYHLNPGSFTLSLGSIGCNLKCPWCQNWSISREWDETHVNNLKILKPVDLISLVKNRNLESLTFTYNEPSIMFEFVSTAAKLLKENKIETNIVSNGYINSKLLTPFYKDITGANIDLKSFSNKTYRDIIGGDLNTVLNTLTYLNDSKTWLEITTLIIPELNDSKKEIEDLSKWIFKELGPNVPLHFSAFHPSYKYNNKLATSDIKIIESIKIAKGNGLNYVYSGNIKSDENSNTYCPNCSNLVIKRVGYKVRNHIKDGKCEKCGKVIEGIFN